VQHTTLLDTACLCSSMDVCQLSACSYTARPCIHQWLHTSSYDSYSTCIVGWACAYSVCIHWAYSYSACTHFGSACTSSA